MKRGTTGKAWDAATVAEEFFFGASVLSLIFKYDRAPSVIENAIRKHLRLLKVAPK